YDEKYRLNPAISMLDDLLRTNKDYRGTEIRDPYASLAEQSGQAGAYILSQSLPISWEPTIHPKPGATWTDKLLPILGLPPAPSWTARTRLDNDIWNRYLQTKVPPTK